MVFRISNLYVFADCMHFHFYLLKGLFNLSIYFFHVFMFRKTVSMKKAQSTGLLTLTLRREQYVLLSLDLKHYYF